MNTGKGADRLEAQAVEALNTVLSEVSGIELNEMWSEHPTPGHTVEILARVEVFGHAHTLAS